MSAVVVDTGPVVALLDASERHHRWVKATLSEIAPPLVTCEAVLSEAAFLLARMRLDASLPVQLVTRGVIRLSPLPDDDAPAIAALMRRYADVPMSFADACLVRIVERTERSRLLTLDGDFRVYRQHGRRVIPLLVPAS